MQLTWSAPNRRFEFLDALGVLGLVGLLVARFIPVARLPFWGCTLRSRTGWPCLGCGLTRAADRVSHGNLLGALDANPLGALGAMAFALLAIASLLHLLFKLPVPELTLSPKEATRLRWALGVAVLFNYAYVVVRTRFPELLWAS